MKRKILMILILASILVFSGCSGLFTNLLETPGDNSATSGGTEATEETGLLEEGDTGVVFSFPVMAPWLSDAFADLAGQMSGKSTESRAASRAFIICDTVEMIIFDSENNEVRRKSFSRDMNPETTISGTLIVPPATGCTLEVNIYNHTVSETEAVLSGTSAAFDVLSGAHTAVGVTCLPVSPTVLADGTGTAYSVIPFVLDNNGYPEIFGGELWYSFTAPATGIAVFSITLPADTSSMLSVFTPAGLTHDSWSLYSQTPSITGSFMVGNLTAGENYYAALLTIADTTAPSSGTIQWDEFIPYYPDETDVPDPELRLLLEYYTDKGFALSGDTPDEYSITDADLAEITGDIRTDGYNGGPVCTGITNLKGLEYCDGADFLLVNMNDLGGVDANWDVIADMDNLQQLDAYYCNIQSLDPILDAENLHTLAIVGNLDLDETELSKITAAAFQNLKRLDISSWDRDDNDVADYVTSGEWDTITAMLGSHAALEEVNLDGFFNTDAMFTTFYGNVLSSKPDRWKTVSLAGNQASATALASLANLSSLQTLNLERNTALSTLSWILGMTDLRGITLTSTGITEITSLQALKAAGGLSEYTFWGHDVDITSCASLDLTESSANGDALEYLVNNGVRINHDAGWIGHGPVWESMFGSPNDGAEISGMTWDGTNLWMVARGLNQILKVDPSDGTVLQTLSSPAAAGSGTGLTWDGTNLWFTSDNDDPGYFTIYKIDPADGSVLDSFAAPGSSDSAGLTWDGTYLWNTGFGLPIYKLQTDGTVVSSFDAPTSVPEGLAWADGCLWVLSWDGRQLYKIDPASGDTVTVYPTPVSQALGLTYDGTSLWLSTAGGGDIYKMEL